MEERNGRRVKRRKREKWVLHEKRKSLGSGKEEVDGNRRMKGKEQARERVEDSDREE